MQIVIYNQDGSIKYFKAGESIQQGDDGTKSIFLAIDGLEPTNYACSVLFELPDGEVNTLTPTLDAIIVFDETISGYLVTLTEAQTLYAGNVKFSARLINTNDNVLATYQTTLKINPTGYNPNATRITQAEYDALLQTLASYEVNAKRRMLEINAYTNPDLTMGDLWDLIGGANCIDFVNLTYTNGTGVYPLLLLVADAGRSTTPSIVNFRIIKNVVNNKKITATGFSPSRLINDFFANAQWGD